MHDDRRKAVAQQPGRTTATRYGGRDKEKGVRLRTVGEYKGGGRQEQGGRQAGATKRKGSAWRSGGGAAPRACVYI